MKYKAPVRLRRETCLSPYTAPALIATIMYFLFGQYRIWGSHSGGVENPVSIRGFINPFSNAQKMLFSVLSR